MAKMGDTNDGYRISIPNILKNAHFLDEIWE